MSARAKIKLAYLLKLHFSENPGASKIHRYEWGRYCRRYGDWLGHEPTVDDLTVDKISRHMTDIVDSGRSAVTANARRRFLLTLARRAVEHDLLPKIPRVKKLKEPKRTPKGFFDEQVGRIIGACRVAPSFPKRVTSLSRTQKLGAWTGLDWEILCRLVWEAGYRPTSLLTARYRDITGEGWFSIQAENVKTQIEKADQLSPELVEIIEARRQQKGAGPNDLILDWPGGRRLLWTTFRKDVLIPAGLNDERMSFYGILKAATSYICREGDEFDAMRFRGHTDINTTRNYLDPRIAYIRKVAANVLPKLNIVPPKDPDHHPE